MILYSVGHVWNPLLHSDRIDSPGRNQRDGEVELQPGPPLKCSVGKPVNSSQALPDIILVF